MGGFLDKKLFSGRANQKIKGIQKALLCSNFLDIKVALLPVVGIAQW